MAQYSVHSMLVSLNIEDRPLRYMSPRGPAMDFVVTYNQKETQQPAAFSYSNLGPKWTFNWLSYVSDDPTVQLPQMSVYVPNGGAEIYSFDQGSQSFLPHPQSHATLVKTGSATYERRLPDGSKANLCAERRGDLVSAKDLHDASGRPGGQRRHDRL